jgi:membrane fusion protein (multidrug efflux system)
MLRTPKAILNTLLQLVDRVNCAHRNSSAAPESIHTSALPAIPAILATCPINTQAGTALTSRSKGLFSVLAVSALLAACSGKSEAPKVAAPVVVGVVTMQPERQIVTSELPGRTSAFLTAEIRPQVGGIVEQRPFIEGAQVKTGQLLYQLDNASYLAAQANAQAMLTRSKAAMGAAKSNANRNTELVKINAISQQLADDTQALLLLATSDVAVAKAALETARINLAYTRIVAPITGRITTSSVTPGALVTANQTAALTTVLQLDPLYVDITQSSTELLQLKTDMARGLIKGSEQAEANITLILEDGSTYAQKGKLKFSGVNVNTGTGTVTLRAVVPNPNGLLMPGMYVRARLEAGVTEQAILTPQQSVTREASGKATVLVVGSDNKVERRVIEIDKAVGNRWLVTQGLTQGELVIVDGLQRITAGDTVKPLVLTLAQLAGETVEPAKPSKGAASTAPAAAASSTTAQR